jgi:hypothetical protein
MPNLTGDDLQTCGSSSKNSVVLGSSRAEGRKGEKRGEIGLFIGTGIHRLWQGVKRIEGRNQR